MPQFIMIMNKSDPFEYSLSSSYQDQNNHSSEIFEKRHTSDCSENHFEGSIHNCNYKNDIHFVMALNVVRRLTFILCHFCFLKMMYELQIYFVKSYVK